MLKKLLFTATIAIIPAFVAIDASAAIFAPLTGGVTSGELKFNGTVSPSCNLGNFVDGTITANGDQTQLSSLNAGGTPAAVDLRANVNGYTLPLGVAQIVGPNGILTDAVVSTTAVGNGTDLLGVDVSQFGPNAADNTFYFSGGSYNFAVNASVTRADGSAFPAGSYTLHIPVSCTM
jgi:hypothetical protein